MCRKPNSILLQLTNEDKPIITIRRTTIKTPYGLIKLFNLVKFKLKIIFVCN